MQKNSKTRNIYNS